MRKWVTPTLAIDPDWVEVLSADEATVWIQEGGDHVVVSDDETAAEVLHNLGLTSEEIADRLHFAATGEVLE